MLVGYEAANTFHPEFVALAMDQAGPLQIVSLVGVLHHRHHCVGFVDCRSIDDALINVEPIFWGMVIFTAGHQGGRVDGHGPGLSRTGGACGGRCSTGRCAKARAGKAGAGSALKLMQAQIEPHFMFNTLACCSAWSRPIRLGPKRCLITYLCHWKCAKAATGPRSAHGRGLPPNQQIRWQTAGVRCGCSTAMRDLPFPPMIAGMVKNAIEGGIDQQGEQIHVSAGRDGRMHLSFQWPTTGRGSPLVEHRIRLQISAKAFACAVRPPTKLLLEENAPARRNCGKLHFDPRRLNVTSGHRCR